MIRMEKPTKLLPTEIQQKITLLLKFDKHERFIVSKKPKK